MPRKKTTRTTRPVRTTSARSANVRSRREPASSSSYKNLLYGVIAVFVLFIALAVFLRIISKDKGSIGEPAITTSVENIYTVKKGDSLSSIAQSQYNHADAWQDIAKANNINNPNSIEVGQQLTLPSISSAPSPATVEPTQAQTVSQPTMGPEAKISTNSYTVKAGDTLWDIANRAYGDPYKWVEIAKVNHLANPDLIHSGNVFTLPR